jgi:hypothetical protein
MTIGFWPQVKSGNGRIVVVVRDGELAFTPLPADHSRRQKSIGGAGQALRLNTSRYWLKSQTEKGSVCWIDF